MSAIPQVILLRSAKKLSATIQQRRGESSHHNVLSNEETMLHFKDPPRVRGHVESAVDGESGDYRDRRLDMKSIRDILSPEDEMTSELRGDLSVTSVQHPGNECTNQNPEDAKREALLNVDPSCWVPLAESGMFQRAEDTLSEAAKLEFEVHGRSERYCNLLHSMSALYDRRSYEDLTGQRSELSYQSVCFASESLAVRRELLVESQGKQGQGLEGLVFLHKEKLATTLALLGQSLCNYALDGASKKLSAKEALINAESHLKEALDLREEMNHRELAEAEKGMGYLYYCRGSVLLQIQPDRRAPYQVEPGDNPESLYLRALPFYFRSLSLYIERDGELVESSVRMTCNVAQVYQHLSVSNNTYLEQAYQWYKLALERQQEAFGDAHVRTKRIKADLKDLEQRRRAWEANQEVKVEILSSRAAAEEAERAAAERKKAGDELMDRFLAELREERAKAPHAPRASGKPA